MTKVKTSRIFRPKKLVFAAVSALLLCLTNYFMENMPVFTSENLFDL